MPGNQRHFQPLEVAGPAPLGALESASSSCIRWTATDGNTPDPDACNGRRLIGCPLPEPHALAELRIDGGPAPSAVKAVASA
ncbi:MAG: hypothetical protein DI584_03480 [Stenotrophomonas sp.]|nr:MAG: hypothetical protein DI584_03480 [Stenotrophomonas sp.]